MKRVLYIVLVFIWAFCLNTKTDAQNYAVTNTNIGFKFQQHPMIGQYINYYQGRGRQSMETRLFRSGRFSSTARRIFREENIPENLVWISQISNEWNNSKNALWLIDNWIAKKYGLRQTKYLDEKRSFEQSTQAVARYLKFLSEKYDDNWEIVLAAYFSGETKIDQAIRRTKIKNFWFIYPYLPQETRNFVPNVLATILIADNREFYKFENVQIDSPVLYDRIRIAPSISLKMIAEFSDSNLETIKSLNPELISTVSPPVIYVVRVPLGKTSIFVERMKSYIQKNRPRKNILPRDSKIIMK